MINDETCCYTLTNSFTLLPLLLQFRLWLPAAAIVSGSTGGGCSLSPPTDGLHLFHPLPLPNLCLSLGAHSKQSCVFFFFFFLSSSSSASSYQWSLQLHKAVTATHTHCQQTHLSIGNYSAIYHWKELRVESCCVCIWLNTVCRLFCFVLFSSSPSPQCEYMHMRFCGDFSVFCRVLCCLRHTDNQPFFLPSPPLPLTQMVRHFRSSAWPSSMINGPMNFTLFCLVRPSQSSSSSSVDH